MNTHKKMVAALGGGIVLVALGVAVSFHAYRQLEDAATAREDAIIVTRSANELLSALKDAETGERGFAMLGDEAFLEPYLSVRDHIADRLEELRRRTMIRAPQRHLDALVPLVAAKMEEMAEVIKLRREHDLAGVKAAVRDGEGKRLMDAIRREMGEFIRVEEAALAQREAQFRRDMRRLFTLIVAASVVALILAVAFACLLYREHQHRLKHLVHLETKHLLGQMQVTNRLLEEANLTLQISEARVKTSLRENGDLRAALDEHAIVAITDPLGKIVYVNDKFCSISQYTRAELIGQDHRLIKSGHHSQGFIRSLWNTLKQGGVWHGEIKNKAKDGTYYWVDTTIVPFLDESGKPRQYVAIRADITARKLTELDAAELASIVASSDDAIIGKTLEGIVTSWNGGAERTFGYTAQEMIGWPVARLIPVGREQEEVAILARLRQGGSVKPFDTVRVCKNGRLIDVSVTVSPIKDAAGKILGASKIVRDISERKKAEEHVRCLNAELERRVIDRTAQLESANNELEAFSYTVSHDLRAPVRAIDGFAQAVLEDYAPLLPDEGQRYLQTIRRSARQMGALIDDLLAFARLGRQELNKRTVDTGQLVQTVLHELGSPWPDRQVELRLADLPPSVGDPALVKQVWVNLISNALKYTRKREAVLIEIGCGKSGGVDTYYVRDNGTGFDMKYADKLFGVFQRYHRSEDYEGTGVGLAIVQRIVHRHGGRIWADAAVDQGATFSFTLEPEIKS